MPLVKNVNLKSNEGKENSKEGAINASIALKKTLSILTTSKRKSLLDKRILKKIGFRLKELHGNEENMEKQAYLKGMTSKTKTFRHN